MKVSKVGHVSPAVSKQNQDSKQENTNIGGILYKNPTKQKPSQMNLEVHIQKLNEQAQRLYNVFNTPVKKEKGSDGEEDSYTDMMIRNFNKITKWLLKMTEKVSEEEAVQKQLDGLDHFLEADIPTGKDRKTGKVITRKGKKFQIYTSHDFTQDDLLLHTKKIVTQYLRNSLRIFVTDTDSNERIYVPEVLEQLVYAFCMGSGYKEIYKRIPQKQMMFVLRAMNADYTKKEQIAKTIKSIQNQNVKVQPDGNGNLRLASADHVNQKKDYKSKKYIFEFIKEYACLDDKKRKEKLLHMRKLILLYFYGEELYRTPPDDLTAMSFGKHLDVDESVFSEEAKLALSTRLEESGLDHKAKQATVKECLRKEICSRYHKFFLDKVVQLEPADYFWLNWIVNEVEGIYFRGSNGKKPVIRQLYLKRSYLCKRIWNNWTAFLAMKYVDIGKAVYHFATPEWSAIHNEEGVVFGKLLSEYKGGLTSFDYERIKANESLERGLATYVTFAVNTFAGATIHEQYRIGQKKDEQKEDVIYSKTFLSDSYSESTRRILQYFGGKSRWNSSKVAEWDREDFLRTMQMALKFVRDGSVHYTAVGEIDSNMNVDLLKEMYNTEVSNLGNLYTDKYCTNNVMCFYSPEHVADFMGKLYQKNGEVKRMPAFKSVINRSRVNDEIKELVGSEYYNMNINRLDADTLHKLEATQYFLLSEIYYHDFVVAAGSRVLTLFYNAVGQLDENDREYGNAARDFKKRIREIKEYDRQCTLETICEIIMTDYNMQNTEKERIASRDVGTENDRRIYKHFPLLLRQCIRKAFLAYVNKQEQYSFIKQPIVEKSNEAATQSEAILREKGKELNLRGIYSDELVKDERLLAWYAAAHFLSPKYLNQLNGLLLSYIQMVNGINNRAAMTGNRIVDNGKKTNYYQKVVLMLSLVRNYVGRVSAEITDYFDGDTEQACEAYAGYLSDYVAFYEEDGRSYTKALNEFAMQKIETGSPSGYVEIYFDGENPKVNRNVIFSMLYGNIRSIREMVQKVTLKEIQDYYKHREQLLSVLESGRCQNREELHSYKEFQLQKNRIELVDIKIFTEMINDLYAKLISWTYLRERDLLYFQLGVHYLRLRYEENMTGDLQREICGENVHILDGGILYQMIALNTYALPLYHRKNDKIAEKIEKGMFGTKFPGFLKIYPINVYLRALELFEHVPEHDDIIDERNYIDHFKYYARADQSMMELYGEVYDRFFMHDLKLKKSVSYILEDILKSYFVISEIRMSEKRKISNKNPKGDKYERQTCYPELYGVLQADELTYKLNKEDKRGEQVEARTKLFLKQLKDILEYKREK